MCIRLFWKEKGGGRGLFKPLKHNSQCRAITGCGVCLLLFVYIFKSPPRQTPGWNLPHPASPEGHREATSSQLFLDERDQSGKALVQVGQAQLPGSISPARAAGGWLWLLSLCPNGTLRRTAFGFHSLVHTIVPTCNRKKTLHKTILTLLYMMYSSSLLPGVTLFDCSSQPTK